MELNIRRSAIALCLGLAFLQGKNALGQDREARKVSVNLEGGLVLPSGKELANVFDVGFVIEPAVRKNVLTPGLLAELTFSASYLANRYSEYTNEIRENIWLYGPSLNALYDIPLFKHFKAYPKIGVGYLLGDNYLTPKGRIYKDKDEVMHSKGFSFNMGLHFQYDRWCFTGLYILHKPDLTPDEEVKGDLGMHESKLYGNSFTLASQKMNFNHLRFTIGLKLNR